MATTRPLPTFRCGLFAALRGTFEEAGFLVVWSVVAVVSCADVVAVEGGAGAFGGDAIGSSVMLLLVALLC